MNLNNISPPTPNQTDISDFNLSSIEPIIAINPGREKGLAMGEKNQCIKYHANFHRYHIVSRIGASDN